MLDTVGRMIDLKNMALYRDDGLISIRNGNRLLTSKILNSFIRAFKYMG